MAHEMGRNFGLLDRKTCECDDPSNYCIMDSGVRSGERSVIQQVHMFVHRERGGGERGERERERERARERERD